MAGQPRADLNERYARQCGRCCRHSREPRAIDCYSVTRTSSRPQVAGFDRSDRIFAVADTITHEPGPSVTDDLNYAAKWNATMVLCLDVQEAMTANMGKRQSELKN